MVFFSSDLKMDPLNLYPTYGKNIKNSPTPHLTVICITIFQIFYLPKPISVKPKPVKTFMIQYQIFDNM